MFRILLCVLVSAGIASCTQDLRFSSGSSSLSSVKESDPTPPPPPVTPPETVVKEQFKAPSGSSKADILFIVDVSPSMYLTLANINKRLGDLLTSFSANNIDWQVGISNASLDPRNSALFQPGALFPIRAMSYDNGQPFTFLNVSTPSYWEYFAGAMAFQFSYEIDPDYCERPPYCAYGNPEPMRDLIAIMNSSTDPLNAPFFREGSTFIPVIISSSDENAGQPQVSVSDVVAAFRKNLGKKMAGLRAVTVAIQPNDAQCLKQYSGLLAGTFLGGNPMYGSRLSDFATQTNGKNVSLCDSNLGKTLSDLKGALQPTLLKVTLRAAPAEGSVRVTTVPASNVPFTVNGNMISFSQALPANADVNITYIAK